ncbi:aquaporin 1 [Besnoitia besnoiti]|uniref:Aquaporin 1 n=1 Tax=Besnoitia besnoiti TaxID=94643 RepID=A0A2A9MKB4_BESBE|nr:aquaporin 1 [Besnoitia besnoiti]PFH35852.1 aquaporin 1 [Besnoitia besnoiti]
MPGSVASDRNGERVSVVPRDRALGSDDGAPPGPLPHATSRETQSSMDLLHSPPGLPGSGEGRRSVLGNNAFLGQVEDQVPIPRKGAHLNPATSLCVYLTNPLFSTSELLYYFVAQVSGCLCGSLLGLAVLGEMLLSEPPKPFKSYGAQVFREAVPTWWMIYTITVLSYGVSPEKVTDVIVGLCVAGCILSGSLLGATMNPSVSLGVFLSQVATADPNWEPAAVVIGVLAPLLGTCFAILTYYLTHAYHRPMQVRFIHFR